jgi:hypothetical protein
VWSIKNGKLGKKLTGHEGPIIDRFVRQHIHRTPYRLRVLLGRVTALVVVDKYIWSTVRCIARAK